MRIDDIEIDDRSLILAGSLNVVVDGRHGLVCINRFSPIGRSYVYYGEHAENEIAFCRQFIPAGGTVIDVGAHQGTHALAFSRHVGEAGQVIAFEPQRQMFQNILATAAINSLSNIRALNAAVGAEAGMVRIKKYDYAQRGHFSGMRIMPDNAGEQVPLMSLDTALFEPEPLSSVDFLKIDVEGYEAEVLEGARRVIETHRPVIYHEFHASSADQSRVLGQLRHYGYQTFRHSPAGFNPESHFGYSEDRFQGGRDHNAVSVPAEDADRFATILSGLERQT